MYNNPNPCVDCARIYISRCFFAGATLWWTLVDPQTKTKIEIERSCTAGGTKKNLHAVDEEQEDFFVGVVLQAGREEEWIPVAVNQTSHVNWILEPR